MADHQAPCVHPVSLPSIHEMFPAHLMRPQDEYNNRHKYPEVADSHHCQHCQAMPSRGRCSHSPLPHSRVQPQSHAYTHHTENVAHDPRLPDVLHESDVRPHADPRNRSASHIYSFDVLRSDPMSSSLQHLASSGTNSQQNNTAASSGSAFRVSVPPRTASNAHIHNPASIEGRSRPPPSTAPDPAVPAMISFPVSRPPSKPNQSPSEDASDDENPGEGTGKKHICPTCFKRFNRPSSLRIHVNTHTGATPFRCPWPNCGREFNVNSNMRRHYRNHTTPGFSRANLTKSMARGTVASVKAQHGLPPYGATSRYHQRQHPYNDGRPLSPESSLHSSSPSSSPSPRLQPASIPSAAQNGHYSYSHLSTSKRAHKYNPSASYMNSPGSSLRSSSPSNSPSPRLQSASIPSAAHNGHYSYSHLSASKREHKYNPSAPYMHSLADTRVSTALRPAFHS